MPQRNKKIAGTKKRCPKQVSSPKYSTDNEKIIWRFDRLDKDGPFAFDLLRKDFKHQEVLGKIIEYSNMTWDSVKKQTHDKKSKHHYLESGFSASALQRIKVKLSEDEQDSIFSFALQNKLRLIGIREQEKFHVIWYDPEHQFCPSKK